MKAENIKIYYEQNLPHIQPLGATFFVTFRLKGSIPAVKLFYLRKEFEQAVAKLYAEPYVNVEQRMEEEHRRFFLAYDKLLDDVRYGPTHLKDPEIADLIKKELHRFDGDFYDLIAYTVMVNHVHILIDTSIQLPEEINVHTLGMIEFEPLQNIMKRIKGPTAIYVNRLLKRKGRFWQKESFDRYMRGPKETGNSLAYILNNPVKAKLVREWRDHPHTYYKYA